MRWACSAALLLAACSRPQPLIICHNGNCTSPDITRDDTLDALRDSFALDTLDGMEWDTFWYGAENTCLFAHDLDHDVSTPASAAGDIIADNLAANPRPFTTLIDIKPHVGPSYDDRHTPEQLVAHASCALDNALRIANAAAGQPLTVGLISVRPELLSAVVADPKLATLTAMPDVETMLIGDIFAPYAEIVPDFADFTVPLDGVEYHPDFMTDAQYELYTARDMDLIQWSFVTTPEAFDAIERYEPRMVITNEAVLLNNWENY
jgi:hypothetical protein